MIEWKEMQKPMPEVTRHLRKIAERGPVRMDDPQHGAIHGTSIETIISLCHTGRIPGKTLIELHYERGDLSVYPTPALRDEYPPESVVDVRIARENAISYAR